MKKITILAAMVGASIAASASAHTTSLGYVPGTNPGEVTFWTGSYDHGITPSNEGTFTLQGVTDPTFLQVVGPNILPTSTMPTGLVDGTNNFHWDTSGGLGSGGAYGLSANNNALYAPDWWQGITFSGLAAGTYTFTCGNTCGTTAQWDSWSSGVVTVTLTGRDVGGSVPEPSTWAMLLLGFLGIGLTLRRNQGAVTRAKATKVSYV